MMRNFMVMMTIVVVMAGMAPGLLAEDWPYRILEQGILSDVMTPGRQVFRTQSDWARFWKRHQGNETTAVPEVNFNREMVLAINLGGRPTGGCSVKILGMESAGRKIKVHVQYRTPRPGELVAQCQTSPYVYAAFKRSARPLDFGSQLAMRILDKGNYSGITLDGCWTIYDEKDWDSFWQSHTSIMSPPCAIPYVDFSREAVLAVSMGTRSSGGYGVTIGPMELGKEWIDVYLHYRAPGAEEMVTMALSQPYCIVAFERSTLPLAYHISDNVGEVTPETR